MPPDLVAHLRKAMGEPFARPHADCCFFVADWILARTGIDPAADLRGTYTNATGALRLIRAWGDFLTMWRVHMALAGFNETRTPAVGDVGVVRGGDGAIVAAIRVPGAWVGKAPRGLTHDDMPAFCAWSLARG
ncbi:DUF6950 family protein [Methylobacterium sp. HMF5984]|uniref:DUF6950 family protein n=1 Tax=Methylobacterium sp. HMF5984 TaxID=3367370 RepID=UPI003852902A